MTLQCFVQPPKLTPEFLGSSVTLQVHFLIPVNGRNDGRFLISQCAPSSKYSSSTYTIGSSLGLTRAGGLSPQDCTTVSRQECLYCCTKLSFHLRGPQSRGTEELHLDSGLVNVILDADSSKCLPRVSGVVFHPFEALRRRFE